jgi:hypothetical protein
LPPPLLFYPLGFFLIAFLADFLHEGLKNTTQIFS